MPRSDVSGIIYGLDGSPIGNLPETRKGLKVSTTAPGGCGRATYTIECGPPFYGLVDYPKFSRLDLYYQGGLFWRGRIEDQRPVFSSSRAIWTIQALGYASHASDDCYVTGRTWAAGTALEQIVKDVRNELCPLLSSTNRLIHPTGVSLSGATTSQLNKYPTDILATLAAFGDATYQRLYWFIWPGQEAGLPELEFGPRRTSIDYHVSVAEGAQPNTGPSAKSYYNRIAVQWTPPGSTAPVNSLVDEPQEITNFPPVGVGFTRTLVVQANVTSDADAKAVGRTVLAYQLANRAVSQQVAIAYGTPITDSSGSRLDPPLVLAGRNLQVDDLEVGSQHFGQYQFYCQAVDWDEESGDLSVTTEQPEQLTGLLGRLQRSQRGITF